MLTVVAEDCPISDGVLGVGDAPPCVEGLTSPELGEENVVEDEDSETQLIGPGGAEPKDGA